MSAKGSFTINALETAAWGRVDVAAIRAVELHGVQAGKVGSSAGDNMCAVTVHTRACTEDALLILVHLYSRQRCAA